MHSPPYGHVAAVLSLPKAVDILVLGPVDEMLRPLDEAAAKEAYAFASSVGSARLTVQAGAPADALASPTDSLGGGRADIFADHASVLSAADMRLPSPRPTPSFDEADDGRDVVAPLCAAMLVAAAPAVVREYGALRG